MHAAHAPGETLAPQPLMQAGRSIFGFIKALLSIIVPTVLAFLGANAVVNLLPVRYVGEVQIVAPSAPKAAPDADQAGQAVAMAAQMEAVARDVQGLSARGLAAKVIAAEELTKKREFDSKRSHAGPLQPVFVLLGLAKDAKPGAADDFAMDAYFDRLQVQSEGRTGVIRIEFQAENPILAANIANKIADLYLGGDAAAPQAMPALPANRGLDAVMKKLIEAEARAEAFRSAKGLARRASGIAPGQQLAELTAQHQQAREQQGEFMARAKAIRDSVRLGRTFETSDIVANEAVKRLLDQRAQIKAQIAIEEKTLLPGHPKMKDLGTQLNDLEIQIRSAAERMARGLENDSRAAGARLQALQAELEARKKGAMPQNADEVALAQLEGEAANLREQMNAMHSMNFPGASLPAPQKAPLSAPQSDRILARATPQDTPVFPKKMPIVLAVTLGTFVMSLLFVLLAPKKTKPARQPAQMPAPSFAPKRPNASMVGADAPAKSSIFSGLRLPAALAGMMPKKPEDPHYPLRERPNPVALSGFSSQISTQQAMFGPAAQPKPEALEKPAARPDIAAAEELSRELAMMGYLGRGKLVVVHGLQSEAKTSRNAMRYGRRLANDGSTIVIDLLGQKDLYLRLLGQDSRGLGAFLDNAVSVGDIIHRDPRSSLHVIPSGEMLQGRLSGAFIRDRLSSLIEVLSHSYGTIIIDAGTIGSAAEMFTSLADVIVLVSVDDQETVFMQQTALRLEALRNSPVLVVHDALVQEGVANDVGAQAKMGTAS